MNNDTSGFYKLDGELLYGPNFVMNAAYELLRETHDQHVYPVDGWYWFDSQEQARAFFDLPAARTLVDGQWVAPVVPEPEPETQPE